MLEFGLYRMLDCSQASAKQSERKVWYQLPKRAEVPPTAMSLQAGTGEATIPHMPVSPPLPRTRFAQRVYRRLGDWMDALAPELRTGIPDGQWFAAVLALLERQGLTRQAALRQLRQLAVLRIQEADCAHQADMAAVCQAMTSLAEFVLEIACEAVCAELDAQHGMPLDAKGQACAFWIIGMGKLGSRELNVSSDIDLVYVYEEDGETAGRPGAAAGSVEAKRSRIDNAEYFARVAKGLQQWIGSNTEDGFVFRMDLALRPNGSSGPAAVSLEALEEYFLVQGREWERFAWLKSRALAPTRHLASARDRLRKVVTPFVFRRYLDYGVLDSLRNLHRQIREHAAQQAAGRPERLNDVKLGRGGIREIEFFVQLHQVVRGGQYPELRTRPTLDALQRMLTAGLVTAPVAQALADAYVFLRNVEHRIQYLDDQQTHVLPTAKEDLLWIAMSLGLHDEADLLDQLRLHRDAVAGEFEKLLGAANEAAQPEAPGLASSADPVAHALDQRMAGLMDHPLAASMRDAPRARLQALLARVRSLHGQGEVVEEGALRFCDWLEKLLRRDSYIALLYERPLILQRVLRVLAASRWSMRYLALHPGVIDELASTQLFEERFDAQRFCAELLARKTAMERSGEGGEEVLLQLLRQAHHAETFRTLARDLEGKITVEQVADDLSALADAILQTATQWAWEFTRGRHRPGAELAGRFGIVAYGKLGGKELGYGSDLDIVFLFDDPLEEGAQVAFVNLARKLIQWMTLKTSDGDLYEIDNALRPNGSAGLLVTPIDAYEEYQLQRGSNAAWTWEHQAMTRARFVAGDRGPGSAAQALLARFDAVRVAVLTAERDPAALAQEITAMRTRVRQAQKLRAGRFDLKHSHGGMVDVEFIVQFLVLAHARSHAELVPNLGNIALLKIAAACGLLDPEQASAAGDAYREFRRLQHLARLDESPADIDLADGEVLRHALAVTQLWGSVFGASA
jgi:glutamate-ammonia-ligase adenylyltransferase